MIDSFTIERIKDAANIVDVVSEFVSLKKVGVNYRGLCPFHNDHTPSFYVSPARRTCHCFVCGEGGDSVGFIMKHEQLTYPDALRWLARRYNIEIQEKELNEEQKRAQTERESMFIINAWAADYFADILENDIDGKAIGMQYFRQRGIRDDIIKKFKLGFSLSNRSALSDQAVKKGYQAEYLVKTGLCYRKDGTGDLIDRFAGRVIFPWIGVSGKVVAFGGRVLDSRTKGVAQKYVNSPDSDIYHKDHELYGIYQAKKAIAKENLVYMVEGYTDVISMHQCGIENVVANSGTALSEHQIHILHRFTPNIVLLYDGDAAGIKAALRGTDMLLKEGMNVKVMLLPDGDDPDSFARKHTAEEFRAYIKENQTDFIAFKSRVMLDGVTDPHDRSEAITSIIKSISVIGDPIVRAAYIQDCSVRLGFNEQTLTAKLNEEIRNYRDEKRKEEERKARNDFSSEEQNVKSEDSPADSKPSTPNLQPSTLRSERSDALHTNNSQASTAGVDYYIIKLIIEHGEKTVDTAECEGETIQITVAEKIKIGMTVYGLQFSNSTYNDILNEAAEHSHDPGFKAMDYFTMHPDYNISSIAVSITSSEALVSESMKHEYTDAELNELASHLIFDLYRDFINSQIAAIKQRMQQAGNDIQQIRQMMEEMKELQEQRKNIARQTGNTIQMR